MTATRHILDKELCLARAELLARSGRPEDLRYACVELRFCLEAIAYEKLRVYGQRLPADVLATWQPPQAVRALLDFEPLADQDFVLRVSRETEPGVPSGEWRTLGHHKTLRVAVIRKYYNKLGSFLHAPFPPERRDRAAAGPSETEILEIIEAIRPAITSRFDSTFATVVTWQCSVCEKTSIANVEGIKKSKRAICLNSSCRAEHVAEFSGEDEFKLHLDASPFECLSCNSVTRVENRKISIGLKFSCKTCNLEHTVLERHWRYGANPPAKENSDEH